VYRDILENYDKFSNSLKSNYPEVIVDVISVINQGIDTKGNKVRIIGLERYYQSTKQQAAKGKEKTTTMTTTATAAAIRKEKIPLSNDELVERLVHMTNRDKKRAGKINREAVLT
jgi:hypothetical protein